MGAAQRARKNTRYTPAFSLIELVFVVTIFGVLIAALPYTLSIAKKSCYHSIANNLAAAQEQISLLYAAHTLASTRPAQSEVMAIIDAHRIDSKNCFFGLTRGRLGAKASGASVNFTIEPSDFSVQPSFKCPFSSNALCREILLRTKSK